MIKLNKTLVFILFTWIIIFLTGCDYTYYIYHNTDGENLFLNKEVISIDLINYKNPETEGSPLEYYEFSKDKLEILETLEPLKMIDFIEEISQIGGISGKFKNQLSSPHGQGIRVVYNDDSFTLITVTIINGYECIFLGEYTADLKLGLNFGISWQEMIDDFKVLINNYFIIEID